MVAPIVAGLALSGLAASGIANIGRGINAAQTYNQFKRGYKALDEGYRRYLARQGRQINPHRALDSYYGKYLRNSALEKSGYLSALGAGGGSLGAGIMTRRWLV